VAGYEAAAPDGKPAGRYAALWVEKRDPGDDAEIEVAIPAAELHKTEGRITSAGMALLSLVALRESDQRTSYSGIARKSPTSGDSVYRNDLGESDFAAELFQYAAVILTDLSVSAAVPPMTTKERASAALQAAEAALKAKSNDPNARFARANAHFQLADYAKAIVDLDALIKQAPQMANALQIRAIAHARLRHNDQARADLALYEKGDSDESNKLYLAVIVAAELGEAGSPAFEKLDAALKSRPKDSDIAYNAACAYALASQAIGRNDAAKGRALAVRATSVLKGAVESGYSNYSRMQEDVDLDPIRGRPEFGEIMKAGHVERAYAAIWSGDTRFEAIPVYGLDPAAQLKRCRDLAEQGYRMVSLSVGRTSPEGPVVTASVWHRPVITEQAKDQLAERQARAAIALVRMGKAEKVWRLLQHSEDPRLRSFIINWLKPLGADPSVVAAALASIVGRGSPDPALEADRRSPAPGSPADTERPSVLGTAGSGDPRRTTENVRRIDNPSYALTTDHSPLTTHQMDAILFHPETSVRRALVLALGTYGADALSPGDRGPLTEKLLELYKNDPDAGIHGAAEWTLRQWNEQARLEAALASLPDLKNRGDRRWFVNSQRQTFALIQGPVEFRMGSPPTDPDRYGANELPHRHLIPRRFAIAAKEVTVEEYQQFVRENPDVHHASNDKLSPDPKGPMNLVSWFHAAAYCNWLSRKENLPECYEPNDQAQYAERMKIRADSLARGGYRLPTEAEWEYACRAGAITSRYYGQSSDLLGKYAWYLATSPDRAQPCATLLPNDLGLFDVLGNVWEWCQERPRLYRPDQGCQVVG
jgi:formylglycine-generating enzyme required for sulfatase activity